MTIKLSVKTNSKKYPIFIGKNLINNAQDILNSCKIKFDKCLIIVDKKVPKKKLSTLKNKIKCKEIFIFFYSSSEINKNQKNVNMIIDKLFKNNFKRNDIVISFGGGITGDIVGYAASIYKRGLKFINIPTTLLSQVDASIGGKTGINSNQGKNLIGTFYQPDFIMSDISMLKSLPRREIVSGYGEILKHSLISDKKFFLWLIKNGKKIINRENKNSLKNAIIKSCKIKCNVVNKDEKEKDLRMILNFGHTFAHGFEGAKNFSKKINHGEAVLLGMMLACDMSNLKKQLSFKELALIKKHYLNLKLPTHINKFFKKNEVSKIVYFMKKDKKNIDKKIYLILLKKIGETTKSRKFSFDSKSINKFLNSYYF